MTFIHFVRSKEHLLYLVVRIMTSDTLHPAWRVLKTPYDLKTNPFQFSEANRHGSDAVIEGDMGGF